MSDPWQVLGLPSTATYDEAHRAYTVRAKLLHPDNHQDAKPDVAAEAQRAMGQLNTAWEEIRATLTRTSQSSVPPRTPPKSAPKSGEERFRDSIDAAIASQRTAAISVIDRVTSLTDLRWTYEALRKEQRKSPALRDIYEHLAASIREAERQLAESRDHLDRILAQHRKYPYELRQREIRQRRRVDKIQRLGVQCCKRLRTGKPVEPLIAQMKAVLATLEFGKSQ